MDPRRRHSPARPYHDAMVCRHRRADQGSAGRAWIQADVALCADDRTPWWELGQTVAQWRAEGRIRCAFFVRKPPGLRLRLLPGPNGHPDGLPDDVSDLLTEFEQERFVRGWRFGTYQPEVDRFGGRAGMALAHQHFDASSRFVMALETLPLTDQAASPRALIGLASINHLLARCVDDAVELGDVWVRVNDAMNAFVREDPIAFEPAQLFKALTSDASWLATLPHATHNLLADARRENDVLGDRVRAAVRRSIGRWSVRLAG